MDLKASIKIARKLYPRFHCEVTKEKHSDEAVCGAILGLACALVDLSFDEFHDRERALTHVSEAINAAIETQDLRHLRS